MSWPEPPIRPEGPLAGLRVLDISRILAGPFAATILSDLGADVIKVERAGVGDEPRRWGPPFAPTGTAAYFYACNRNRRSLSLDLKQDADQRIVQRLAADADVVFENFLPGVAERMGVDAATLRASNPRLVYCTVSGYGRDSQRSSWPALDFVIQAHAGMMSVTGPAPGEECKVGVPIADLTTGLYGTIGVLAAVQKARATGEGSDVEVTLADSCVALLANQSMNWLIGGIDPRPGGNTHPNVAPYQTIRAGDRDLAIAATSEEQFRRLCTAIERPDLVEDPRFRTNPDRVAHRAELEELLSERLSQGDAAEWVARLNEAGVPAGLVNTVAQVLEEPDTAARLVTSAPAGPHEIPQVRTPIRIDGAPLPVRTAPPGLGDDDEAIRAALEVPT